MTTSWRLARRVLESRMVSALTVPHGVDRYLGMVNPLWSLREVRAVVVAVTEHTADSVTITLRTNGNWLGARAGQYVLFTVEIDGVRRGRCFSLAGIADGIIEITAKVNPAGIVSGYLKRHALPGLRVVLSQARGEFVLPARLPEHILMISGGSGITPVMSLLRALTEQRHTGRITFLHYAFTPQDVIYRAELAKLAAINPRLTLAYSYTEQPGAGRLDGLFGRHHLLEVAPDYADALSYVCGPSPLMAAVDSLWRAEGLGDRLLAERFTLPIPAADLAGVSGQVHFARSGRWAPNDGRSLLEQAESAGLRPEHGCRMGVCHTCTSVKTGGAVRNLLTGAVTAEPGERIQLCVTTSCGDVELDI